MLRHLNYGVRDFRLLPDVASVRYNWIFLISFDGHLHPRLESGKKTLSLPKKHNFFVIPPDTKYVLVPDRPKCFRAVFHFAYVSEVLRKVVLDRTIFSKQLKPAELAEVRKIMRLVKMHHDKPTELSQVVFELGLSQLTMLALGDINFARVTPLNNVGRQRVGKAVAWFAEHIGESPSLTDISAIVHVSPTQLRRHFYEEFGKSPKSVFIKLRMQRAAQLLSTTSDTLSQLAETCGFQSATDFCRAFKKAFKVTPNCWRHQVSASSRFDKTALSLDDLWK